MYFYVLKLPDILSQVFQRGSQNWAGEDLQLAVILSQVFQRGSQNGYGLL